MDTREIIPGLTQIVLYLPGVGFESFINAWLIKDEKRGRNVLVETGPAVSVPQLAEDIKALGIDKIDYLLYTHIHLDHAGGAGQFHRIFPDTKFIVPPKGRIHLVDPEKLIQGSRENLGELCDIYKMPEPLPADALAPLNFELDGLMIIDTPGHSPHHSSYVYDIGGTNVLFAGEAGGCYFELPDGSVFMHPATPHKFYYETAIASLDKLIALQDIDLICYPHFGCSRDWKNLLISAETQMALWKDIISALPKDKKADDIVKVLLNSDPMLKNNERLSAEERERDSFFLRQSVDGYLGNLNRKF